MLRRKIIGIAIVSLAIAGAIVACSKKTEESTSSKETMATVDSVATTTTEATTEYIETTEETTPPPTNTPTPTVTPTPFPVDPNTPEKEGYNILWCDEFDAEELNTGLWSVEARKAGYTNNELQRYAVDEGNVYLEDGCLKIKAFDLGNEYTSGKVTSRGGADFMYGYIEVKAKMPEGQGLWPAIWLMPTKENKYGSWPASGEIDMVEILGHQTDITYSNIHYGNPHGDQQGVYRLEEGSFSDDFHVFACEWEPGSMKFYVDGELFHTINDWYCSKTGTTIIDYPAPFNQQFYLILNLAVGGDWPGSPDETTNFDNAILEIDYVRVYQKDYYDENVTKPETVLRDPDENGNYVLNGDMLDSQDSMDDDTAWGLKLSDGGAGSASITDGVLTVTTDDAGRVDYSVQLVNPNIPLEQGVTYKLVFDIKAGEDRTGNVCITGPRAGYIRYLEDTAMSITTEWQTLEFEFTVNDPTDAYGRLEFNLGDTESTADVMISNVSIVKVA